MLNTPEISVIIPIYNSAPFLERCLNSVLTQTLTDIEILCIDDGSTDHSCQIVQSLQHRDPRVHLFHQENSGVSAARNVGINYAQGSYLYFMDSDDYVESDMLRLALIHSENNLVDIFVFGACPESDCKESGLYRHLKHALIPPEFIWTAANQDPWELTKMPGCFPFIWNKLFRRDFLEKHKLKFEETLHFGEDAAFLITAFQYASRVRGFPLIGYHYCLGTENSLMHIHGTTPSTRVGKYIDVLTSIYKNWDMQKMLSPHHEKLLAWSISYVYSDFIQLSPREQQAYAEMLVWLWTSYGLKDCESLLPSWKKRQCMFLLKAAKKPPNTITRLWQWFLFKIEIHFTEEG